MSASGLLRVIEQQREAITAAAARIEALEGALSYSLAAHIEARDGQCTSLDHDALEMALASIDEISALGIPPGSLGVPGSPSPAP